MIYSGIAKVTNDNMIIESAIQENNAIITVWTKDMKQATGFLAYLKNLIMIAFDSTAKLEGKVEKISQKILDSHEIIDRCITLWNYCEEKWNVGDILILLKEISSKFERSFPGSSIIEKILNWIDELQNYREGANIPETNTIHLEYQALGWLTDLIKLAYSNLETYIQTFPEQQTQIQQLLELIEQYIQPIAELEEKYTQKIVQYLLIIQKETGLTIYEYSFTQSKLDADLMSGFITAIQKFGSELAEAETSITRLAYQNFEIELDDTQNLRAALILSGSPTNFVKNKLKSFVQQFELQFKDSIATFRGNVGIFRTADTLIKDIFE